MAIQRAQKLLAEGHVEEADRESLAILSRDPANIEALMIHGLACTRRGQFGEAEATARAILGVAPGNIMASYLIADLRRVTGREAEALEAYANALRLEFAPAAAPGVWSTWRALHEVILLAPIERWRKRAQAFAIFGALLAKVRPDGFEAAIATTGTIPPIGGPEADPRLGTAFGLLGFQPPSPREWNAEVFERFALPWMLRSLEHDRLDEALALEGIVYGVYVKQSENEAHFRDCVARWKGPMAEAGKRFAARQPAPKAAPPGAVPRVAFFLHNVTELAHVQMTLGLVEGNAALPAPRFEPHVYCLTGQRAMIERFRKAGAHVEVLFESTLGAYAASIALLRQRLAERGVDVVVWVSLVLAMPFAFAMRMAPAQVWWALKYHAFDSPDVDGYITGGGLEGGFKQIGDRTWRAGSVPGTEWTAPGRAAEARAIRAKLGHRLLFGTFGREQKLDSEPFVDAVAKILQAVPDAGFLWTGKSQLPSIQSRLEAAGVASRCHFIGWVETKLYAQVIDVFLDSFPFPCGFTLYEAMAAGKPAVYFSSPESDHTGMHALVGPLLEGDPDRESARLARGIYRPGGEDNYLRARDPGQYAQYAVRLAGDAALRQRVGQAGREFIERFLADKARAARMYADHFDAILAERRAAKAS